MKRSGRFPLTLVRSISLLTMLGLLLPSLSACVTGGAGRVPPYEAAKADHVYVGVTRVDGEEVSFDPPRDAVPAPRIEGEWLLATVNGAPYTIALDDAREVWFDDSRVSWARTGLLVGGIAAGLVILYGVLILPRESLGTVGDLYD